MKPQRILILLVPLIFFLQGCTKNDPEYYYIPDDFRQWVIYQPGTYWIYLNETTGVQDCTYVTAVYQEEHLTGGNGSSDTKRYYESIAVQCSGPMFSEIYTTAQKSGLGVTYDLATLTIKLREHGTGYVDFSYGLLMSPQFIEYRKYEEISNEGVKQVYPQEIINGVTFSNVYNLCHEYIGYNGDSLVTEAHFARNSGIVKFRYYKETADTTWSLLRYKIVQ